MSASIPVFSDRPKAAPTPKLRALVKFPGNVDATTGLSVEKTNGTWTFELDYSEFALSAAPAPGTSTYILSYDPVTGVYLLVPTQLVAGASEAYVDAQNAAQDTANSAADALRVLKTGDTMTGNLEIADAAPVLTLRKSASGQSCAIVGITGSSFTRWAMSLGNSAAEVGSNTGSHFEIARYNDGGTYVDSPLSISRTTGAATIPNLLGPSTLLTAASNPAPPAGMALAIGFTGSSTQYGIGFRPATDTTVALYFTNAAAAAVGTVSCNATATAYNTSSSAELKEDLKSFDAGNIIDNTNVYDFAWKSTGERAYGVIAQQAVEVYPTAVTYLKEQDWYGVDYSKYVPVLLQELKALRVRVAELEDKLTAKPS